MLGNDCAPYCLTQEWMNHKALAVEYHSVNSLKKTNVFSFQLCCSLDGGQSCQLSEGRAWWVPTPIMTSNATHVELYAGVCGTGQGILGLRYAWRLTPCPLKKCAVYSKENSLPAPPFVAYPSGLASGQDVTFDLDWSKPVHVWEWLLVFIGCAFLLLLLLLKCFIFCMRIWLGCHFLFKLFNFFCNCILLFNHRNSQDDGGDFFGMLPRGILCTSHFTTQSAEILCADNDTIFISIRTEC